jgi:hypothetical protein
LITGGRSEVPTLAVVGRAAGDGLAVGEGLLAAGRGVRVGRVSSTVGEGEVLPVVPPPQADSKTIRAVPMMILAILIMMMAPIELVVDRHRRARLTPSPLYHLG